MPCRERLGDPGRCVGGRDRGRRQSVLRLCSIWTVDPRRGRAIGRQATRSPVRRRGSYPSTADRHAVDLANDELGHSVDGGRQPRFEREQQPVRQLRRCLRLSYYDPERDYPVGRGAGERERSGRHRGAAGIGRGVLGDAAKALVQEMIAADWARRDRLTLRLAPRAIGDRTGIAPRDRPDPVALDSRIAAPSRAS